MYSLIAAKGQAEQVIVFRLVSCRGEIPVTVGLFHRVYGRPIPLPVQRVIRVTSRLDFPDSSHACGPAPISTDVGDVAGGWVISVRVDALYLSRGHC